MKDHRYAIETDSRILLAQERDFACATSRTCFFPIDGADFSVSGCLDAPAWIPAGGCSQWHHNAGHVGMTVVCRDWLPVGEATEITPELIEPTE